MHLKRQKVPKRWPIPRKGTAYVVKPNFGIKNGIPILVILRDLLKIAQNRKEVKKALYAKNVLLNDVPIKNEKNSAFLFDIITLVPSKKSYKLIFNEHGKFEAEEIKEAESHSKIFKIINKKTLKGKKTQLNLKDGKNFISDLKCKVNDSVIFDFKKGNITKCLPLKEKSNAFVFAGNHSGSIGNITKIDLGKKMIELKTKDKTLNILIKQMIVLE